MTVQNISEVVNGKLYSGDIVFVYQSMLKDLAKLSRTDKYEEEKKLDCAWLKIAAKMTSSELDELRRRQKEEYDNEKVKYELNMLNFAKKRLKLNTIFIVIYSFVLILLYTALLGAIANLRLVDAVFNLFVLFWYIKLLKNEYKERKEIGDEIVLRTLKI